jgi:hypothetical protein
MKYLTIQELIDLLDQLPEDIKATYLEYVDFDHCSKEEISVTTQLDGSSIITEV